MPQPTAMPASLTPIAAAASAMKDDDPCGGREEALSDHPEPAPP